MAATLKNPFKVSDLQRDARYTARLDIKRLLEVVVTTEAVGWDDCPGVQRWAILPNLMHHRPMQ